MFQAFNSSGTLQVSDLIKNYVLIQKGTYTTTGSVQGTAVTCNASTTLTGNAPVSPIIVFPANGGYRFSVISGSGSSLQVVFYCYRYGYSGTTNYYIFDQQPNITSGPGLVTYGSDGTVYFNSNFKPLIVGGIANVPTATDVYTPYPGVTISGLPSRTWGGAITLPRCWVRTETPTRTVYMALDYVSVTSTSVTCTLDLLGASTGGGNSQTPPFYGGQLIAVDITNL